MAHSKFGWDYPAGVTDQDIEDAFGGSDEDARDEEAITTTQDTQAQQAQHTLADYLAARDEEVRAADEFAKEQAQQRADDARKRSLDDFARAVEDSFTPAFRAALNLSEAVYSPHEDANHGDYYTSVEATFTHDGDTWILYYWNGGLHLRGPQGYLHDLRSEYSKSLNKHIRHRSFLDGLRGYPAWLQLQQEYEAAKAAALAEEDAPQEPQEPQPPKPAAYCEGTSARAFLRDGVVVVVEMVNYGTQYTGTVADFNKRNILLTLDSGAQVLISRAQIDNITYRVEGKPADEVPF